MTTATLPKTLGRYQIRRVLGEGAMGVVYLAWDPTLERPVALKTTRADLSLAPEKAEEYRARFMREARLAGGLRHPSIVTIYDVGRDGDIPYFAMEYIPGVGLDEVMRMGRNDPRTVLGVIRKVAAGLKFAHTSGVVHRDIKPANIIVGRGGEVKITDFGIARPDTSDLTQEGQMLGSPSYMSPEQIQSQEVGPASDLFSLAVVVYTWLTGKKPFAAETVSAIIQRILNEEALPVTALRKDLPAGLNGFFVKALAKRPADRHPDAEAFYRGLAGAFGAQASSAERSPTNIPRTRTAGGNPADVSAYDSDDRSRVDLVLHQIVRSNREGRRPDAEPPKTTMWAALAALVSVGFLVWVLLE